MRADLSPSSLLPKSCSPRSLIRQFFLAESPRYLIKAGHPEKAAANLCWLRNLEPTHPYIEEELAATVIEINREREITFGLKGGKVARYFRGLWNEASAKVSSSLAWSAGWKRSRRLTERVSQGIRNRLVIGAFVMMWQNMSGINAINCELCQIEPHRALADPFSLSVQTTRPPFLPPSELKTPSCTPVSTASSRPPPPWSSSSSSSIPGDVASLSSMEESLQDSACSTSRSISRSDTLIRPRSSLLRLELEETPLSPASCSSPSSTASAGMDSRGSSVERSTLLAVSPLISDSP